MEVTQDSAAMLPPGDFDKLDKREKEAFHQLQEDAIQHLLKASNEFQLRFPGLRLEWKFQADVYKSPQSRTATVRYSDRVY